MIEYLRTFAQTAIEYWQQIVFLVIGIGIGYLLHLIIFKAHIRRSSKKGKNRNVILIEPRNRKTNVKKDRNAHYFECIENAQWQKTKDWK